MLLYSYLPLPTSVVDATNTMQDLMMSSMMKNGGGNDCIGRWDGGGSSGGYRYRRR
jgi:hypothetical protein